MGIEFTEVTVLNDLMHRLNQVTDQDIAVCARKLKSKQEGDREIGVIDLRLTKALWALLIKLGNEMGQEILNSRTAVEIEIEQERNQMVAVLDALSDIAREVFYAQVKTDLGYFERGYDDLEVRAGWMLVRDKSRRMPLPSFMQGMIEL